MQRDAPREKHPDLCEVQPDLSCSQHKKDQTYRGTELLQSHRWLEENLAIKTLLPHFTHGETEVQSGQALSKAAKTVSGRKNSKPRSRPFCLQSSQLGGKA